MGDDNTGKLFVGGTFSMAGAISSPIIVQANIGPQAILIEHIGMNAGAMTLECLGKGGDACVLERANDVLFTKDVTVLLTTNSPPGGVFTYTDLNPPSSMAFTGFVCHDAKP